MIQDIEHTSEEMPMAYRNRRLYLLATLVILAITFSACDRPFPTSQVSLNTPTQLPTNFFVSPFPTSDNPMAMVEELSTGTAMAATAVALTAGTPAATQVTETETTPDTDLTPSATPDGTTVASVTPTLGNETPTATQALPTTTVDRPTTYTLQKGEFPYCIARRYNLNPDELIALNGLQSGEIFIPGLTLQIPQTGNPWPGERALHSHPDTYTVDDANETIYGVACYYGDVDPAAISQANNLPLSADLTVGQQLTIP
jgi:LysM repeat protein